MQLRAHYRRALKLLYLNFRWWLDALKVYKEKLNLKDALKALVQEEGLTVLENGRLRIWIQFDKEKSFEALLDLLKKELGIKGGK